MGFSLTRSLPNLISLARLVLVPAIISMISAQRWKEASVVFVVAGVSDALDGWIARSFNLRSELGAYLDPLADKALIVSIYVTLAIVGVLPATIAIIVVARDAMIVGAFMISWFLDKPVEVRPLLISKLNTLVQLTCAALVLGAKAFDVATGAWLGPLIYLVAALSLASLGAYFNGWIRHMSV
ncbi:CDP-alcohol phosphatidyltransferase family protein [Methylocapsa palsarum]|uniref:CDP-diacylglycerol--glycerol-3-phosphate 3-phosphatidyltransferase n=1 Tax=Methylocapsa palsarum TaxID=1612308 RepID=A0A1I3XFP4_9HYPH|nr:CDP-alcohol phosphatidyltransferase family protein [Methylocapsa palsarum]SFK18358.1 cardiolipin synthase [Methylocapsa palsarum]